MSGVRSRSISRTRVTKVNDVFPSGESLDPIALLNDLLPHVKSLDVPLVVTIKDNRDSVSFILSVFIQKEYEISGDVVKFGFKRLKLNELKATISFDVSISDE